jgi:predicted SprT family Zn-dependent metalloprotease
VKPLRTAQDVLAIWHEERAKAGIEGWTFGLNTRFSRTLGQCTLSRKLIELGDRYALYAPEADVRNTIRHELAHAKVGNKYGHGIAWQWQAFALGARPERCQTGAEVLSAARGYRGVCEKCGEVVALAGRPRKRKWRHTICEGEIRWEKNHD